MIVRATGEILFAKEFSLIPQELFMRRRPVRVLDRQALSVPGWTQHFLGVHASDHGAFEVEVVTDPSKHVQTVLLLHEHRFYRERAAQDSERRAFHEGVLAVDLAGQREFSWGEVFCRLDREAGRDWIVVAYALGPRVPMQVPEVPGQLVERAGPPAAD